MNIEKGIQLNNPNVFIPWNCSTKDIENSLSQYGLKKVTKGYYCINATILNGLECVIGFQFGLFDIKKFEIFRGEEFYKSRTVADSYSENQRFAEIAFGKPNSTIKAANSWYDCGYDAHTWIIGGIKIEHNVFERFGPEERFWIAK